MKVLVNGCNGKMGQEVAKEVILAQDMDVICGVDRIDMGDNDFPVFTNVNDIDVTPDVALKRLSGRDKTDRLDLEKKDFHERVYKGYQEVLKMYPDRIVRIDGNQELDKVIKDCLNTIRNYLK